MVTTRAGQFLKQPGGFIAFIPAPLPPDPPIAYDQEMVALQSRADQAVGRLDGLARTLPNPDLFVAMYIRREAVLSSQIEGTESSLDDVLAFEVDPTAKQMPPDVAEVVNHVRAMNHGLRRLQDLPVSLRLIREIHAELLRDVRGAERRLGEFRSSQNWIGPQGTPLGAATFVPPPVPDMHRALDNFEKFLHEERELPVLIHAGVTHAQFETIHPFLDGNGRIGRLLITFLLVTKGVLTRPLLSISHFLRRYRAEYYDRLMAVRLSGDWEGWLKFFLRAVAETASEATETAGRIIELRERDQLTIQGRRLGARALRLHDLLFEHPLVNVNFIRERLGVSFATANKLVNGFVATGIVDEVTGGRRNRLFRYSRYLELFAEPRTEPASDVAVQTTESPSAEMPAQPAARPG